jgi:hypothetical protein
MADDDGLDIVCAQAGGGEIAQQLASFPGKDFRAESGIVEDDVGPGAYVHRERPVVDEVRGQAGRCEQLLRRSGRCVDRVRRHGQDRVAVIDHGYVQMAQL